MTAKERKEEGKINRSGVRSSPPGLKQQSDPPVGAYLARRPLLPAFRPFCWVAELEFGTMLATSRTSSG